MITVLIREKSTHEKASTPVPCSDRSSQPAHFWAPPMDIFEADGEIVVRTEVGGMEENDFSIYIDNNLISINGKRHDSVPKRSFYQMELQFGEFHIDVSMPTRIKAGDVSATYRNGLLLVKIKKSEPINN